MKFYNCSSLQSAAFGETTCMILMQGILEDVKFLCLILKVLHSKHRQEVTLREINIAH